MSAARLRREIAQAIRVRGPLSVASWMNMAVNHPRGGYYASQTAIRASASLDKMMTCSKGPSQSDAAHCRSDFVTAPEMTQVFGEALAVRLSHELGTRLGLSHRPFRLVELGPGTGSLMRVLVHTLRQFSTIWNRFRGCVLVERSAKLKELQQQALAMYPDVSAVWTPAIDGVAEHCVIGDELLVFVSNEFFDALPVHMYMQRGRDVREILVDAIDVGDDAHFRFVTAPCPTPSVSLYRISERFARLYSMRNSDNGAVSFESDAVLEYAPEAERIATVVSQLLQRTGGIFLAIDYGSAQPVGHQTLRAIKAHRMLASPLESVGEADLSADVDFGTISQCFPADRFHVTGPLLQGDFLLAAGARERTEMLARACADAESAAALCAATERLVDPSQMGSVYKALIAVTQ